MFRKKGNKIESDKGFSVEIVHGQIIYKEGDKVLRMGFERLTGPNPIIVYLGFPDQWEPPFEKEKITRIDWRRIAKNVLRAYRSQGIGILLNLVKPSEAANLKLAISKLKEKEGH